MATSLSLSNCGNANRISRRGIVNFKYRWRSTSLLRSFLFKQFSWKLSIVRMHNCQCLSIIELGKNPSLTAGVWCCVGSTKCKGLVQFDCYVLCLSSIWFCADVERFGGFNFPSKPAQTFNTKLSHGISVMCR